MTKKSASDSLYQHLGKLFTPLGFTLQRDEKRFVRLTGEVLQSIDVPLYDFSPRFRFSLVFGFRIEAAAILEEYFDGEATRHPTAPLCYVELNALAPEVPEPGSIVVSATRSVADAVAWLAPILTRAAFPFLGAHQDVASLDRLMNGDERELDGTVEPYRSVFGVIFAYLARNPELPRLIIDYRKEVVPFGAEDLVSYDRLAEHLRQHWVP